MQPGQCIEFRKGFCEDDTVNYTYQNRLRTVLSLAHPNGSPWTEEYGYDAARRLIGVESAPGTFAACCLTLLIRCPSQENHSAHSAHSASRRTSIKPGSLRSGTSKSLKNTNKSAYLALKSNLVAHVKTHTNKMYALSRAIAQGGMRERLPPGMRYRKRVHRVHPVRIKIPFILSKTPSFPFEPQKSSNSPANPLVSPSFPCCIP